MVYAPEGRSTDVWTGGPSTDVQVGVLSTDVGAGVPSFSTSAATSAATSASTLSPRSLIVNGGFEENGGAGSSTFEGWSIYDQGQGSWFVKTGEAYDAPEPPEGSFAASTEAQGWGLHILYQDVELPPEGAVLSFQLILRTEAEMHSPETLEHEVWPNQQFRVDVIDPEDDLKTVEPILSVYQSPAGPPGSGNWSEYETITADLEELGGQTVRIRFAQVDNVFYFRTTVDAVQLVPHVTDETPPVVVATLEGTLGENGWYTSDVAVSWSVSDEESPFTMEGCGPSSVTNDTAGEDITCTATSDGGTTEETVTVRRDTTEPQIAFSGNAGSYTVAETVTIVCTATDATSGIATASCPSVDAPAYTFEPGENTLAARATDVAGHGSSEGTSFTVEVTPESLCAVVETYVGNKGISGALCKRLADGNYDAFRNQLGAQAGKQVSAETAEVLSRWVDVLEAG